MHSKDPKGKTNMIKRGDVPTLVIVNHLFAARNTPKLALTETREHNHPSPRTDSICSRTPEDSKRLHRRFVSDIIPMMFSRQEQAASTRSGQDSSENSSSHAIHEQKLDSSDENEEDDNESTVTPELPLPAVHGSNEKSGLSSWFLPTGRPLAAAPVLLLAQPGTAITKNDAKNKKRRRSWVNERRSRCKVACDLPSTVVEASLDDDTVVDAAVTLSKLGTEPYEEPMTFASARALAPPPFQLITNRKIGMLPYPLSFQIIASSSR